jgi:predicted secreted hydrolase
VGSVRVLVLLAALATLAGCGERAGERDAAHDARENTGLRLLGGEAGDGFARATESRPFAFPRDHAEHPAYRTEWWYFTGNLATPQGRHFGFELTFFRYALAPPTAAANGASAWRSEQVWMAHFAITDTAGRRFFARERITREALGLAGATAEPLRVWVEDWAAAGEGRGDELTVQLTARDDVMGLALRLTATVPHVAQGDRGLDAKGASIGNASHYYSVPRLAAEGSITLEGRSFAVSGLAWLDREWSTSSLDPGIEGWDWFALHLSDGSSLMFYRLRTATGASSPYSKGSLVGADGSRTALSANEVALTVLGDWTSAATGVRYPVAWRMTVPKAGLALDVRPYLESQELNLTVRYWEGAVRVEGRGLDGPVSGQGYLELAGY